MSKQAESQAGGRPIKPAATAGRKRRRLVLATLALLAVGIGTWAFWPRQRQWEEITLDLGNGVTIRLVLIPAGTFMMGSPDSEPGRNDGEGPQHEVTISKPFYMGVFEVTQEQYEQVMGANPSFYNGASGPVERITWFNAMEFCERLMEKTGRTVRLPTEAEWEYACRAGTTTAFHTGDELKPSQANANFSTVANPGTWDKAMDRMRKLFRIKTKTPGREPMPVGSFPPNAFGLYDMHGNVWEWCADWYGEDYYAISNKTDPPSPIAGEFRIWRGGGWSFIPPSCRSATRWEGYPVLGIEFVGFRVVVEME